jgi:hypothetical protein
MASKPNTVSKTRRAHQRQGPLPVLAPRAPAEEVRVLHQPIPLAFLEERDGRGSWWPVGKGKVGDWMHQTRDDVAVYQEEGDGMVNCWPVNEPKVEDWVPHVANAAGYQEEGDGRGNWWPVNEPKVGDWVPHVVRDEAAIYQVPAAAIDMQFLRSDLYPSWLVGRSRQLDA